MFKLNIECTKDISFLKINFADGTSTVIEDNPSASSLSKETKKKDTDKKEPKKEIKETKEHKDYNRKNYMGDDLLPINDGDSNFMYKNAQNVKLPELPDIDRPVKVADELQNLDI
jgi:hypothetical protein